MRSDTIKLANERYARAKALINEAFWADLERLLIADDKTFYTVNPDYKPDLEWWKE